jgi:hypothetical protein
MPQNPAETPASEKPKEIGISHRKSAGMIDRRISVAPMMDWTDDLQTALLLKVLRRPENPCLLYVSSTALGSSRRTPGLYGRKPEFFQKTWALPDVEKYVLP